MRAASDPGPVATKSFSKIDALMQRVIMLDNDQIRLIDTDSIVIEKWVRKRKFTAIGISSPWCLSNNWLVKVHFSNAVYG
jgi:hypothetical protein